ncbi:hypothetical protein DB347_11060 [Opitutaceae bacterium EW11]|nr:hypothetical protein DB347_11060 [Opitutaceae bacterium EW11]
MMNKLFPLFGLPGVRRNLKALVVGLLLVGLTATGYSQKPEDKAHPKELSDKVSEALNGPIKTAKEAHNWDEAIRQVDALITTSSPDSYDRAVLVVEKAQTYFQKNELHPAIAPLEEALKLSDAYGYFEGRVALDMTLSLAQLYANEAQASKQKDEQHRLYTKAYTYVRRWLDQSKTPNPDLEQFAASILLQQATLNSDKVDIGLVKQAQAEIEKGMRMSVKPKDQFYVLLLAALQQQGEYKKSAEVLELLVKQFPNNKSYWQTLAQTYVQLEEQVRAIITFERAQQYGILNTPKENFNLVALYFNIKQYDKAIELLESGLRNGQIESEQKNWELLAASYQQLHKEPKAIEALKEASKRFPKSGAIDLQIGQIYYSMDKTPEAYAYIKSALDKGIDKPSQTYVFLSYLAFEMKKLEEAKDAAQKAMKADPNSKDAQRLLDAINDAIRDRDAQKNQPL